MPVGNEDPKPSPARDEDPKPTPKRDEDPKPSPARGMGFGSQFGGGAGWVVVAFISPVGLNVPDLAINMLSGGAPSGGDGQLFRPIGELAVIAQEIARKEAEQRKKLASVARRNSGRRRRPY
jgi:hypothetical protein